jgi:mono/diheme cytochrome c family protein
MKVRTTCRYLALCTIFVAQAAMGADADNGKRLAQARCSNCHIVIPGQRDELANSPPFEIIAGKFRSNPDMLIYAILDPHPRMNFIPTRREAEDIAAYINTLAN